MMLVLTSAWAVTGCSGQTRVFLTVDLLSYLKTEERIVEFWLPPFETYSFYFLPGAQLDATGGGPDTRHSRGMLFDFPAAAPEPPFSGLTVAFDGGLTIRNLNATGTLELVLLSIYVAPADATNIYQEGVVIASVPADPIDPGESLTASFGAEITEGSPVAAILDSSSLRIGMKLTYPESAGIGMTAGFELTSLELSVSGRPFFLISEYL